MSIENLELLESLEDYRAILTKKILEVETLESLKREWVTRGSIEWDRLNMHLPAQLLDSQLNSPRINYFYENEKEDDEIQNS